MRAFTRIASAALAAALFAAPAFAAHAAPSQDLPSVSAKELNEASSPLALINPHIKLSPEDYDPKDLRAVAGTSHQLRQDAANAVEELLADARKAGYNLQLISAFRSYERQRVLFNQYQNQYGTDYAERISARPGTSEHQLGLAADVGYAGGHCQLHACFGESPAGQWVAENAGNYGLIIRYPQGQEDITGYRYEPWHVRYVGEEHAEALEASGVATFEEYHELLVRATAAEAEEKAASLADEEANTQSAPSPSPSNSVEASTDPGEDLLILRFLPPFRDWSFGLTDQ